jgi:hypothetical protein
LLQRRCNPTLWGLSAPISISTTGVTKYLAQGLEYEFDTNMTSWAVHFDFHLAFDTGWLKYPSTDSDHMTGKTGKFRKSPCL